MVTRDTSWIDYATCATDPLKDKHAWDYNITKFREAAVAICEACPVKRECYEDAVADHGSEGIRGGVMFKVRARRDDESQSGKVQEL